MAKRELLSEPSLVVEELAVLLEHALAEAVQRKSERRLPRGRAAYHAPAVVVDERPCAVGGGVADAVRRIQPLSEGF
jgi:hypothetical protein